MRADRARLSAKHVVVLGLLGGILFAGKMVLAALPNVEPVSLLVMVYAVVYGRRALYPIYFYVALECLIWGLNIWSISYLYVWAILAGVAWLLRGMQSRLGWAILAGAFGLCFGALCALPYLAVGRWAFALSWWIAGLPYDIVHCAGNFALALVLFSPCRRLLTRLSQEIGMIE